MDVEAELVLVPGKKPRKAEGQAAMADAEAAASAVRSAALVAERERQLKISEEFLESMATPLTEEELRQREEEREKLLSETWEMFRDSWLYGSIPYDAVTEIPCMRFTDTDLEDPDYDFNLEPRVRDTMQIVSVQVKPLDGGLQWPVDVYGFVAIHDVLDRKRIMVFDRKREDCQSLNKQDSYLRLSGPTRGVVINNDASYLEVFLIKKGLTESEDEYLSKFATSHRLGCIHPIIDYTNKLCTLEMQHYTVLLSVEATVSVRVYQGKWPLRFRGVLNATTAAKEEIQIALLNLNDDELPVDTDGSIKLSRRVVCVEHNGRLGVSLFENGAGEEGAVWFAAEKSKRATHYMHVKKFDLWLEVTVAWSLF